MGFLCLSVNKKRDSVPFYKKDTTKLPKIVIHVHLDLCRSCFSTKKERKGESESFLRANVAYPELHIRPNSQRLSRVLTRHVHGRYPTRSWLVTHTTGGGHWTWNDYNYQKFKQVFTGVPVNFKQDFTGVPKILNKFSRSKQDSVPVYQKKPQENWIIWRSNKVQFDLLCGQCMQDSWLICMRATTYSCMTWLLTHSYVWHYSFMCVP